MLLHINFKVQEVSTSYYLPHNFYDCLFLRHIFFCFVHFGEWRFTLRFSNT